MLQALLALVVAVQPAPTGSAADHPSVELASSFFQGSGGAPDNRNALALVLSGQTTPERNALNYGGSFGWIRLSTPGADGPLVVAHVSNAFGWATYRFGLGRVLDLDLGAGVVLGLTASDPTPRRRVLRTALGHGIAMQGVYDAALWAPGRAGFVLPLRLSNRHRLGSWQGAARLEGAFLTTVPASAENEQDMGRVIQTGLEYALLPRPWLAAGGRLQFVWMPRAQLWKTQWSVVPFLAAVRGRWRVAADLLLNLDEPYGFAGRGQRIWAASLKVGAWL